MHLLSFAVSYNLSIWNRMCALAFFCRLFYPFNLEPTVCTCFLLLSLITYLFGTYIIRALLFFCFLFSAFYLEPNVCARFILLSLLTFLFLTKCVSSISIAVSSIPFNWNRMCALALFCLLRTVFSPFYLEPNVCTPFLLLSLLSFLFWTECVRWLSFAFYFHHSIWNRMCALHFYCCLFYPFYFEPNVCASFLLPSLLNTLFKTLWGLFGTSYAYTFLQFFLNILKGTSTHIMVGLSFTIDSKNLSF